MITIQKEGIGVLGSTYTDDINMTITTGENSTVVIVSNGTVTVEGSESAALQTGDLIGIWGQSNCGRTRVSEMTAGQQAIYATEFTNVTMMNQYVSKTEYANLYPGVNTMLVNANNVDEFGFEASLFKNINDINSTNRYFCVKHGYGSASLETQWYPRYDPLELFFIAFGNRIEQAGINAKAEGINLKLRYMIQMQGEQDAASQTMANKYFDNLVSWYNEFETRLSKIIKAGNLHPDSLNYKKIICKLKTFDGVYENVINQAFTDYAAIPAHNAVLVETDDLALKDSVHFNATSQITLGERIFSKL